MTGTGARMHSHCNVTRWNSFSGFALTLTLVLTVCIERALGVNGVIDAGESVLSKAGEKPSLPFKHGNKCGMVVYAEMKHDAGSDSVPPFVKNMAAMLTDGHYVDLHLRAGNKIFPAHRIIVAASSPVFSSLIYNETLLNMVGHDLGNGEKKNVSARTSSSTSASAAAASSSGAHPAASPFHGMPSGAVLVIQMDDDISVEAVEGMVRYIYTGKVENMTALAGQLIVAADRYGLTELKELCERVVVGQVGLENSIDMYKLSRDINSKKLRRKAFTVMRASKTALDSGNEKILKMGYTAHPVIAKILYIKHKSVKSY